MDFGIALVAAQLLGPSLAKAGETVAGKLGEAMWDKTATIYQAIRRKFDSDGDAYGQASLERLGADPTNEGRQRALASVLQEKADEDASFAEELMRLVKQASRDPAAPQFLNQVYDGGQVDKIIQIGQAGQVHIE